LAWAFRALRLLGKSGEALFHELFEFGLELRIFEIATTAKVFGEGWLGEVLDRVFGRVLLENPLYGLRVRTCTKPVVSLKKTAKKLV